MQTTAFLKQGPKGELLPDDREPDAKAAHLLMRTKGWSLAIAQGFLKTLLPDEKKALVHLEEAPILKGDEVNCILDEIEDRQAAEAELKKQEAERAKQQESGVRGQESEEPG